MIPGRTFWLLVIAAGVLAGLVILAQLTVQKQAVREIDFKTFISYLESNKIQTFDAAGLSAHGTLTNGDAYATELPNRDTVLARELVKHVKGTVRFETATPNSALSAVLVFSPFVFVAVMVVLLLRTVRRGPPKQS